jgi:UDP-perosamine 4-acetyltransferase
MKKDLLILGAGGHAKVVIEAARMCDFNPIAVFDDNESLLGKSVLGVPVKGKISDLSVVASGNAFIAIGNTKVRKLIAQRLVNFSWPVLIHPAAFVSSSATIARQYICAAIVQSDALLVGIIINTGKD